jgi:hypothetical protein
MNEPLVQSYYLKKSLKDIRTQITKQEAEVVLQNWIKQAKNTGGNNT